MLLYLKLYLRVIIDCIFKIAFKIEQFLVFCKQKLKAKLGNPENADIETE